jgi:hypothetical protein
MWYDIKNSQLRTMWADMRVHTFDVTVALDVMDITKQMMNYIL